MSESSGIVVDPAFIDVSLEQPQQEKQIQISYTNNSKQTITLEFFALDFRQKDEFGTIGFLGEESRSFSYSLSSFLQFGTNAMVLQPKEKQTLQVLVKNRPDLSPGGHYAAVIARQRNESQQATDTTQVSVALSSLIFLRKQGGEQFNLSLKKLDWPKGFIVFSHPKELVLTFQNEGNIHVVPYGRLEVRDFIGRLAYKGTVNTSSLRVFPETRRLIKVEVEPVQRSLPLAIEKISVTGSDSLGKTKFMTEQSYLFIDPVTVILLFTLAFLFFRWRRKT